MTKSLNRSKGYCKINVKMGKKRPRGGNESTEEILKGKNRELQKTIRQLQQRIKELENKLECKVDDGVLEEKESLKKEKKVDTNKDLCPKCAKSKMKENIIPAPHKIIIWLFCPVCNYRQRKADDGK